MYALTQPWLSAPAAGTNAVEYRDGRRLTWHNMGLGVLQRLKVKPLYTIKDLEGKEEILTEVGGNQLINEPIKRPATYF